MSRFRRAPSRTQSAAEALRSPVVARADGFWPTHARRTGRPLAAALLAAGLLTVGFSGAAHAQSDAGPSAATPPATAASAPLPLPKEPPYRSDLDAPLMYQLLISEISLRRGDTGTAYQLTIDAARQTRDERLFRRAVEIALHAQDGSQALSAARTWRAHLPQSRDAVEYVAQILLALNRPAEAVEPLRALLKLTPAEDRFRVLATVPALLSRLPDRDMAAKLIDEVTEPFRGETATASAAWLASARGWLSASNSAKALASVKQALAAQPDDAAAALLCSELMPTAPEAEALLKAQIQAKPDNASVRLAYARRLAEASRMAEAAEQIEAVTRLSPEFPGPWLSLGAIRLDLHQPQAAEAALRRFLDARAKSPQLPALRVDAAGEADAEGDDDADTDAKDAGPDDQEVQAYLLLAQAAQEQRQFNEARVWLDKIPAGKRDLAVQIRKASLLIKQGKVEQARGLVRQTPATTDLEIRSRYMAEAAVLREAERWKDAYQVLGEASGRFPDDTDLIYERAMVAEKLKMLDEMEQLLRKVIAMKPDHYNAYNALGFSLADRNVRLPEAKTLIQRALELSPNDAYIVDSLGWVEFRLGRFEEARKLLAQAYAARGDTEIGAHLGEVLWTLGQHDEARRIWREARQRDADNATLLETLKRLKVHP